MTSILERLDDMIRGNLHRLVDRALENSSLALYDEDIRDMEQAFDHYEEATATMYAAARANERRLERHQEDVARLERWFIAASLALIPASPLFHGLADSLLSGAKNQSSPCRLAVVIVVVMVCIGLFIRTARRLVRKRGSWLALDSTGPIGSSARTGPTS